MNYDYTPYELVQQSPSKKKRHTVKLKSFHKQDSPKKKEKIKKYEVANNIYMFEKYSD